MCGDSQETNRPPRRPYQGDAAKGPSFLDPGEGLRGDHRRRHLRGGQCRSINVYAHYTSKDDLRRSGLEHLRKELLDRQKEALSTPGDIKDRSLCFSLTMFEHARDHIDLYKALVGGRGGAVPPSTPPP